MGKHSLSIYISTCQSAIQDCPLLQIYIYQSECKSVIQNCPLLQIYINLSELDLGQVAHRGGASVALRHMAPSNLNNKNFVLLLLFF